MVITYLNRIGWFVGLVLLQVLILNHIHLGGYAIPILYVYLILKLDTEVSRNELLLWGFFLGLAVDIFSNTPGMNAAATVFAAFVRPFVLNLFVSKDIPENIKPSYLTLGISAFIKYVIVLVVIHHTTLLCIESFSFFDFPALLVKISGSSLLSILCILAIEGIRK